MAKPIRSVDVVDTSQDLTPLPLSRKALRSARKIAAKGRHISTASRIADTNVQDQGAASLDSVVYECCICRDDFPFAEGVAPCEAHFICNDCVVDSFDAALSNMELFPAKCCTALPRRLVEHLLSPDVIEHYKARAKEYYTSRVLRVYCVNDNCRRFIPEEDFDNDYVWHTVARCGCGADICVGCKQVWEGEDHRCLRSDEHGVKPEWLPEYSESCRIKQCPTCLMWIEHKEACNHMTCCFCRHEFCFVCLQPWTSEGFHDDQGCPGYGDPSAGYDEDGFEQNARGLHRDTGYDRQGFNRFGKDRMGYTPYQNASDHSDDDDAYAVEGHYGHYDAGIDWNYDNGDGEANEDYWNNLADHEVEAEDQPRDIEIGEGGPSAVDAETPADTHFPVEQDETIQQESGNVLQPAIQIADAEHDDQDQDENSVQPTVAPTPQHALATVPHPRPDERTCRSQRRARRVSIFAPNSGPLNYYFRPECPRFSQLDCDHSLRSTGYDTLQYSYAECSLCRFSMHSFFFYCDICGIVVCEWCSWRFKSRAQMFCSNMVNMLDIVIWAEEGVVPFKAERRRVVRMLHEELELEGACIDIMMEVYEEEFFQLHPFVYCDFGIEAMFTTVEREMRKDYWITTEENVGLLGHVMTFRLDTNRFAPLFWGEDIEA